MVKDVCSIERGPTQRKNVVMWLTMTLGGTSLAGSLRKPRLNIISGVTSLKQTLAITMGNSQMDSTTALKLALAEPMMQQVQHLKSHFMVSLMSSILTLTIIL
jgi:hypothetical protein